MRLPALPFALLLLSAGLASARPEESSPEPRWLEAPEGFRVQLPGTPEVSRNRVSTSAGEVTIAAWSSQVNGVVYSISLADYPQQVASTQPPRLFLEEGRDALVNQLEGTVRDEQDLTLDAHPGLGFTVSSEAGEVRARNFMVGRRLYTLLVLYTPALGAPHAETFLGSLQLTGAQQSAASPQVAAQPREPVAPSEAQPAEEAEASTEEAEASTEEAEASTEEAAVSTEKAGASGLSGGMSASIGFGSAGEDGVLVGSLALSLGYPLSSVLGLEALAALGLQNTSAEAMFFSGTFGPALRVGARSGMSLLLGAGPAFVAGDGPAATAATWGLGARAELFFRFGDEDGLSPGLGIYAAAQLHEGLDLAHFGFSAGF